MADNTASSILNVDLNALAANYHVVKSRAGNAETAAVVKANGYGLGLEPVFKTLHAKGCKTFFVATLEEGIKVRGFDPDVRIFILNGLFNGSEDEYRAHHLIPVLNSLESVKRWQHESKKQNAPLAAAYHFDTGMNRTGFDTGETQTILADPSIILDGLTPVLMISHFACAEDLKHPANQKQIDAFRSIALSFSDIPKSLCNSSGVFHFADDHYDLVRPGYCLYGGNPTPENANPMQPVAYLKTRILQTRRAQKGESTGYGATHSFDQDTMLATVSLGYADGFLRSGSDRALLYWQGQACPVVGRISMDLVTVDISDVNQPPQAGDWLEVLGGHQSVDDLATGTIGYEILTSLGARYTRHYES